MTFSSKLTTLSASSTRKGVSMTAFTSQHVAISFSTQQQRNEATRVIIASVHPTSDVIAIQDNRKTAAIGVPH